MTHIPNLGATIVRLRERKGWTQADLAERANGMQRATLRAIEEGSHSRKPQQQTLNKIATAFGMSTEFLITLAQAGTSPSVLPHSKTKSNFDQHRDEDILLEFQRIKAKYDNRFSEHFLNLEYHTLDFREESSTNHRLPVNIARKAP